MDKSFSLECIDCNQLAEATQEKRQEQLAQQSLVSSHLQNFIQKDPIHFNQLTFSKKVSSKKQTSGTKLSLKNAKRMYLKSTEKNKVLSKQNAHQSSTLLRFKSLHTKITIMYRPNSFAPCVKPHQTLKQGLFSQFKQESKSNFSGFTFKQKLPSQNENRLENEQFKSLKLCQAKRNIFMNKQLKLQTLTKETPQNGIENKKDVSSQRKSRFMRIKKVDFHQIKENEDKPQNQLKYKDTFSAFNSIASLNQPISNRDYQEINSPIIKFIETNQNLEQSIHQVKRNHKKNLTFCEQKQNKFVGFRTVYTLKSMENTNSPSQRSFLDLTYMQSKDAGFKNKLLI